MWLGYAAYFLVMIDYLLSCISGVWCGFVCVCERERERDTPYHHKQLHYCSVLDAVTARKAAHRMSQRLYPHLFEINIVYSHIAASEKGVLFGKKSTNKHHVQQQLGLLYFSRCPNSTDIWKPLCCSNVKL